DWPRLLVATRSFPSRVSARLYTPSPAGIRRRIVHVSASISTMSLDLLQATNTVVPSMLGCAQVGEHVTLPAGAGSRPWPPCASAEPAATVAGALRPLGTP